MSVSDLVTVFESEPTYQHCETRDTHAKVKTEYVGELHTLLVTARVGREYSTNTASKAIVPSSFSPLMNDGIKVEGIFFPTPLLNITIDVSTAEAETGIEHTLSFTSITTCYELGGG